MSETNTDAKLAGGSRVPTISVGVPVYNGEQFLSETIDSILAQTCRDFELIIVDNASEDATEAICREYADRDERIRYFRNPENIGAARNFNRAFELARGEFFRWSNADDLLEPELHEACLKGLMENPAAVLCYGKTEIIDESGSVVEPYDDNLHLPFDSARVRFATFFERIGMVNAIYGLMRADAMRQTGLFGDATLPAPDVGFMAELSMQGQFIEVPKVLFKRRMHAEASSYDRSNDAKMQVFWRAQASPFKLPKLRRNLRYMQRAWRTGLAVREKLAITAYICRRIIWQRRAILAEFIDLLRRPRFG